MKQPAAAIPPRTHLELMDQIQAKLQAEYELLLKRPRPQGSTPRSPRSAMASALRRRLRPRRPPVRRREDWRGDTGVSGLAALFIFMLVVHILIIGAIILVNALEDRPWVWQIGGGLLAGYVLLRGLSALCRRFRPRRRTSAYRRARNCDRDITL